MIDPASESRRLLPAGDGWPRRQIVLFAAVALIGSAMASQFLQDLNFQGLAGLVGLLVVPAIVWTIPSAGAVIVLGVALSIEQFEYVVGGRRGVFTSELSVFDGLYQGLRVNRVDILLALVAVTYLVKRVGQRHPWSVVEKSVLGLLGFVVLAVFIGVARGGAVRNALTEVRPFFYLVVATLLVSGLVRTGRAVTAILWTFVIASGFKAIQGVFAFASVRHLSPRPEAILGHEESLFFAIFVFLTAILWLTGEKGALRRTATALLPIVLVADVANSRRLAWLILFLGLLAIGIVGAVVLPAQRPLLLRLAVLVGVGLAIYLPVYWTQSGGLAQPARALRSAIDPSSRDASSDLYRRQENANLEYNIIHASTPLGAGFGIPIDYVLPIVDLTDQSPLLEYVPHNGLLYLLFRFGVIGTTVFFAVIAAGLIAAIRLARSKRRQSTVVGLLVMSALIGYAAQGYNDLGFGFYRIGLVMGTMLGLVAAVSRVPGGAGDRAVPRRRAASGAGGQDRP